MIRRFPRFFVFAVCCFLALSGQVLAATAPVNDAGAAELKKLVENVLQPKLADTKTAGQGLAMSGTTEVAPRSSFYEIKLSGLSVIAPQKKLEIGTVILQATPREDGKWQISGNIPSPLNFYEQNNTLLGKLSIGSQSFAGIWSPTLDALSECDALYQDIQLTAATEAIPVMTIGAIKATTHPKDDDETSDFSIEKFSIRGKNNDAAVQTVTLTLDKAMFQSILHGVHLEQSQLALKSSFDGFKMSSLSPNIAGLAPTNVNLEVNFDKLPIKKIREILQLSQLQADPAALAQTLPALLKEHGASMIIQNSYLKSPDLNVSISGNMATNTTTPLGLMGKITLSIKGLSEALQKMQTKTSDDAHAAETTAIINGLTMLNMMGQREKGPDGISLSTSYLEVTPDGKVMVNGLDIKSLMGGAAGQAPAPMTVPDSAQQQQSFPLQTPIPAPSTTPSQP